MSAPTATTERRPRGEGWMRLRGNQAEQLGASEIARSAWVYGRISVISALCNADMPDGDGVGLQWHVSISRGGTRRPSPSDTRKALRAFGIVGAEEDNHEPGNARHFWLPVDPSRRVDCQCKVDEDVIVEPDGHRWTNPKPETGEGCRGCSTAGITGRACPIHAKAD